MATGGCCYDDVANSPEARAARADPSWVPDAEHSHCMSCKSFEFWYVASAEWRRHHCRSCGWVVCKGCLSPAGLELDRWVSSAAGHPIHHGEPTKAKTVCRACAIAAPAECKSRLQPGPTDVSRPVSPSPVLAHPQTVSTHVPAGGLAASRPVSPSPVLAHPQKVSTYIPAGGLAASRPVSPRSVPTCSSTHQGEKKNRKKKVTDRKRQERLEQEKEAMRRKMVLEGIDLPSTPTTPVLTATTRSNTQRRRESRSQDQDSAQPVLDQMQRQLAEMRVGTLHLQESLLRPVALVDIRPSGVQLRPQQSQRSERELWKEALVEVGDDFLDLSKKFSRKAKRGQLTDAVAEVHNDVKGEMRECAKTLKSIRG